MIARTAPTPPRRLLAFDLETTGLDPRQDAVVAAGSVPVDDGTIAWGLAESCLVEDPRGAKPRDLAALAVHQVLPGETRGAVPLVDLVERLRREVESGRVLLVHGAGLERGFLVAALAVTQRPPQRWPTLDTLAYLRAIDGVWLHVADRAAPAARRCPSVPTALVEARRFFELPDYPPHDPLLDALATAELYLLLARRFPELHPKVQD